MPFCGALEKGIPIQLSAAAKIVEAAPNYLAVLLQQHKADSVDGKIGKHMGQPGAVDGIQLFVQPVEDHATDH